MMKTGIVLFIISIIALFTLVIMGIAWDDGSRRANFIMEWIVVVLVPLILPIFGKHNYVPLNSTKPNKWVIIHGSLTIIWIVANIFAFSFIQRTMDLSLCISRNFSTTTITAQTVLANNNAQTIRAGGDTFKLRNRDFYPATANETYRIIYLPNSRYVIDIVEDNTGRSLLRHKT